MAKERPSKVRGRCTTIAVAATCLMVGSACGGDPSRTTVDLTQLLPTAEVLYEPGTIDLGTPGAHPYLREGWSGDEAGPAPWSSFVWGVGTASTLEFHLAYQRELRLWFRCHPPQHEQSQRVEVLVNGHSVDTVELRHGTFGEYSVQVPREATAVGVNRVEFRYAFSVRESAASSRDLGVAWDMLRVSDAESTPPARVWLDGAPWLLLPPRTQVDYYLPGDGPVTFELERLSAYWPEGEFDSAGGDTGDLTVIVSAASGSAERTFSAGTSSSYAWTPSVSVEPGETVRVTLHGLPARADEAAPTLALRRPRLTLAPPVVSSTACAAIPEPARTNVIVYLVDTLRRDHLGVYGYGRPVSPRLDDFARSAVVFDAAVAQAPWTRPSVASLFTGLLPPQHGVQTPSDSLPARAVTLAEAFRDAGYDTAAFATNSNVSSELGFDQGFAHFELLPEDPQSLEVHVLSDAVGGAVSRYLGERSPDRPFFLYVHTTDPHTPYAPRAPWRDRFAPDGVRRLSIGEVQALDAPQTAPDLRRSAVDLYDAEIAFNDEQFGRLLDELDARGELDETVIVFTSDHGEAFGEHGQWEHASSVYAEQVDIPLVVRFPGGRWAGTRVPEIASHVDLLPTLLQWVGAETPSGIAGRSLLDLAACPGAAGPLVASIWLQMLNYDSVAVVTEDAKLVRHRGNANRRQHGFELFTRPTDAGDRINVAPGARLTRGRLATMIRVLEGHPPGPTTPSSALPPDLRDRLRALGYIR